MVEDKKQRFLEKLRAHNDEPENGTLYFNFDAHAQKIASFIMDEKTPTPFSIGINGEWGDGKSTLLDAIITKLEEYDKKNIRIIKFNAWEYEKTDVVAGLFQHIENKSNKRNVAKIVSFVLFDQILKSTTKISPDDMIEKYKKLINEIKTLSSTLEEIIGDDKFIIFVDDLDRCNPESMFNIFESIKIFLSIKNVTFVIAADMLKLEQAWELRYNSKLGAISGRQHLEKMFQLRLSISSKPNTMFVDYLHTLLDIHDDDQDWELINDDWILLNHFDLNPRAIKRTLNLAYFILRDVDMIGDTNEDMNAYFENYIKILLLWITLILHHGDIAKIINRSPSYLLLASMIFSDVEYLGKLKYVFKNVENIQKRYPHCPEPIIELILHVINNDESAFRIIKRFGTDLKITLDINLFSSDSWTKDKSNSLALIRNVINDSGLLGA